MCLENKILKNVWVKGQRKNFFFYNTDEMLGPNGSKPWNRKNPWHAPGTADIYSPCGTFGGNPQGCRGGPPTERLVSVRLSH